MKTVSIDVGIKRLITMMVHTPTSVTFRQIGSGALLREKINSEYWYDNRFPVEGNLNHWRSEVAIKTERNELYKSVVDQLDFTDVGTLIIEDPEDVAQISKNTRGSKNDDRTRLQNEMFQLEILIYSIMTKAMQDNKDIKVVRVHPSGTSTMCPKCNRIPPRGINGDNNSDKWSRLRYRNKSAEEGFSCYMGCGFKHTSDDEVACINIFKKGMKQ